MTIGDAGNELLKKYKNDASKPYTYGINYPYNDTITIYTEKKVSEELKMVTSFEGYKVNFRKTGKLRLS